MAGNNVPFPALQPLHAPCARLQRHTRFATGTAAACAWLPQAFSSSPSSMECMQVHQKVRCPVAGCREKLAGANSFVCKDCGVTICLRHRFPSDHACTGKPGEHEKLHLPVRGAASSPVDDQGFAIALCLRGGIYTFPCFWPYHSAGAALLDSQAAAGKSAACGAPG